MLLQSGSLARFAWPVGMHVKDFLCTKKFQFLGQIGITDMRQLREHRLGKLLRAHQHLPDPADDSLQEFQIARLGR